MQFRAREGDFIETFDGLIFDVKGLVHPPDRVIAYVRYLPDRRGAREKRGIRYRKVYDLAARTNLLRARWPEYIYRDTVFNREVQAIPVDKIKQHYVPTERLAEILSATRPDRMERLALDMAETLVRETGILASKIGVSGSILVGLHTARSDVDLILYGSDVARKCYSKLRAFLNTRSEGFSPCLQSDLRKLHSQRNQGFSLSFEVFARQEGLKVLQGKFRGIDYFIRCVKDWNETQESYGDKRYYPVGRTSVYATISDDTESIFTPCLYHIVDAKAARKTTAPSQIVSFRGRFCEQARDGERILARGTLERVVDKRSETYRLVIGENPRDRLMVVGRRG